MKQYISLSYATSSFPRFHFPKNHIESEQVVTVSSPGSHSFLTVFVKVLIVPHGHNEFN